MPGERWIVTGGAGYIGAHVVRALLASGHEPVVIDDLSTGDAARLPPGVDLVRGAVTDSGFMTASLRRIAPTGIIHLAGKKSAAESVREPIFYAQENVGGIVSLLQAVRATTATRIVFSSSCAVYGTPDVEQVDECAPTHPESPYGETKLYAERLLSAAAATHGLGLINLRYFNVVGAASGALADTGRDNLIPLVFEAVRSGTLARIFGADYPTVDGTCVRDYVDVEDVADAHVRAAEVLAHRPGIATYNVGRGEGSSVLEVLDAVRAITGASFGHQIFPRRPGDPARIVARVNRITKDLGWSAKRDLHDMVRSAWQADQQRKSSLVG